MSVLFCCGVLVAFLDVLLSDRDAAWECRGFLQPLSSPVNLLLLETVLTSV